MFLAKKILTLLLIFGFVNLLFTQNVFAQTFRSGLNTPEDKWNAFDQGTFTLLTIGGGITCIGADIPMGGKSCPVVTMTQTGPAVQKLADSRNGGAIGATGRMMAMLYLNQPTSGIQYLASGIQDGFGIVPTAQAQVPGTGSLVISPILKIWQLTRNLAYLGFIVVFIVVGFMVMFRKKLNPQTVVSIQNSLPGLIIALILVTFSYFIAGLIIDLAFVGTQLLGILVLSQIGSPPDASIAVSNILRERNVISIFSSFAVSGSILGAIPEIAGATNALLAGPGTTVITTLGGALAGCLGAASIGAIGGPLGAGIGCGVGALGGGAVGALGGAGAIISVLVTVVLIIGMLQAMFRLLFALINSYVSLVLASIFGPLMILISAIPGQGNLLSLWIRTLVANALVFPAVFAMFLLIAAILDFGDPWYLQNSVTNFTQALPLFGGVSQGFIRVILAYGLLLALPAVPEFVKDVFKARTNQLLSQSVEKGTRGGIAATTSIAASGPKVIGGTAGIVRRRFGF